MDLFREKLVAVKLVGKKKKKNVLKKEENFSEKEKKKKKKKPNKIPNTQHYRQMGGLSMEPPRFQKILAEILALTGLRIRYVITTLKTANTCIVKTLYFE